MTKASVAADKASADEFADAVGEIKTAIVTGSIEVGETFVETINRIMAPAPALSGLDALRAADLDPLRIWSTKGPKGVGGVVSAVLLQATNEIVILHQRENGKFGLFGKVNVDQLSGADV